MEIVSHINPKIFRGYDIRGVVGVDLSEDVYYTFGRAYATYLYRHRVKECTIGRDNRLTSEVYSDALIQGLNEGGIDTIDIGLSLSQIVYYSSYHFRVRGSLMVTASHNPKEYNGLKIGTGYSETMAQEEIQAFRTLIESGDFVTGEGVNREEDIFQAYKQDVLKHFSLKKKWRVVVDASHGIAGKFYPDLLREAGCEVIEQYTEPDGNFPLGVPDPTEVSVLERVAEGVKKYGADIGFSYDADGDRMAVVTEEGKPVWMDTVVSLFSKDVLDLLPGSPIIFNTLCSRQVKETIEIAGGLPVIWKTGHSFIKEKIKELKAPFGGELSGHIFFMDNFYGHDDGAYASVRLLQYLERKDQTISEAVKSLPQYVSSPEMKLGLSDDIKFTFINTKIRSDFEQHWPDGQYTDIDGIRVDLSDRMVICRASQNGPYITIKFEAKTQEDYERLKEEVREILKSHKEIDWSYGVNIEALE